MYTADELEIRRALAGSPRSEQLIACLEGEIAKRDARIVELEGLILDAKARLNGPPVSEAKAQGVVMPERWNVPRPMWKDARQPYGNPLNHADIEAAEKFNLALDEVARLNAAPVMPEHQFCEYCGGNDEEPQDHCMDCTRPAQQVSVPDGWKLVPVEATEAILDVLYSNGMDESDSLLQDIWSAMLANAPAAPAADAGHVFYGMDGNHP